MNRNTNETVQGSTVPSVLAGAVGGNVGQWIYKLIIGAAIVLGLCSVPFIAMQFVWANDTPAVNRSEQRTSAQDHGLRGASAIDDQHCGAGLEPVPTVYADGSWAGWQCLPKQ